MHRHNANRLTLVGLIVAFVLVAILLLLNVTPVAAGSCNVPDDYPTIQDALDDMNEDDTNFNFPACNHISVQANTYFENLVINYPVTIEGAGKNATLIDGSNSGRVIQITTSQPVTLSSLTIQNGSATGNHYTLSYGGGIYSSHSSGNLTLIDAIVTSNSATGQGAAVSVAGGTLRLKSTDIVSNVASVNGNIVYATANADVDIDDSIFGYNTGSSLYLRSGSTTYISNTLFIENNASSGSAIYSNNSDFNIENSQFISNVASIDGGAIYILASGTQVTITNSTMSNNTAQRSGGAILSSGSFGGMLRLVNSTLNNNTANSFGGAISAGTSNSGSPYQCEFISTTFSNNVSGSHGGAVRCTRSDLTISDSVFDSNQSEGSGGAVYHSINEVTIDNSEFSNNLSGINGLGGALYLTSSKSVNINGTLFDGNTARGSYGGGGAIHYRPSTINDFNLSDSVLTNNTGSNGSAFLHNNTSATLNTTFSNNCFAQNNTTNAARHDIEYSGQDSIIASGNWWGAGDGPSGVADGNGDSVSDNITFAPFLTNPILSTLGCPHVNVRIHKAIEPVGLLEPGELVTYTLTFQNYGTNMTATGTTITDNVPVTITNPMVVGSSGVAITQTSSAPNFVWSVAPMGSLEGGVITLTGQIAMGLPAGTAVTNSAEITNALDYTPLNNIHTVGVIIANVDPTAFDLGATLAEDSSATIDALTSATDNNGDVLMLSAIGMPSSGSAMDGSGQITYTPDLNFVGNDSITYTVSDSFGGSVTATVFITVTPVNDPPVAVADGVTVAEDSSDNAIVVLPNDIDVDGDTVAVHSAGSASIGSTSLVSNTIHYTPAADFFGTDHFTYTITDGQATSISATVTVTVTNVNDAPVAVGNTITVAEDSPSVIIDVVAGDSDIDGDTLFPSAAGIPDQGGNAIVQFADFLYIPAANFNGTEHVTYTVKDNNGGFASATITITVTPVNDIPIAIDDGATVAEDSVNNRINVLSNDSDIDADTLTIVAVRTPLSGTATIVSDTIDYTPSADFFGADSLIYTVSDNNGGIVTATLAITVTNVNDAPIAVNDTFTVTEGTNAVLTVLGNDTDPENNALTLVSIGTPDNGGTATISGTAIAYTAPDPFVGLETFAYTISDTNGSTATAQITVNVLAADSDGDGVPDSLDVCPSTPTGEPVDPLGCSQSQIDDDNDNVSNADDICPNTPNGEPVDPFGCSDSQLDDDNDNVSNADDLCPNTPVGELVDPFGCSESQKDDDGDNVSNADDICPNTTVGESVDPFGCSESQKDDDGDNVNNANDLCPNTPTGEAVDSNGCSASQLNQPPNAVDDQYEVYFEAITDVLPVLSNDSDPNGITLTVVAVGQPTIGGTVVISSGIEIVYAPPGNELTGTDIFTYTIADPLGLTATATVIITVTDAIDADMDGVDDRIDLCLNTAIGAPVDGGGCSYAQLDDDADGLLNLDDNCPEISNPLQDDVNFNGYGDVCETLGLNMDFEAIPITAWTESSTFNYDLLVQDYAYSSSLQARQGTGFTWLGGANYEQSIIRQSFELPFGEIATLGLNYQTYSHDICDYDYFYIYIYGDSDDDGFSGWRLWWEESLCYANQTGGWIWLPIDLSPYEGEEIKIAFLTVNDWIYKSSVVIDDVTVLLGGGVPVASLDLGSELSARAPTVNADSDPSDELEDLITDPSVVDKGPPPATDPFIDRITIPTAVKLSSTAQSPQSSFPDRALFTMTLLLAMSGWAVRKRREP